MTCTFYTKIAAVETLPSVEYQVKASFLSHFLSYVEWPEGTFTSQDDSLVITVVGSNRFGAALDSIAQGPTIKRPIRLQIVPSVSLAAQSHLLYFVSDENDPLPLEYVRTEHKGLLTIGEAEGFSKAGGIINFVVVKGKLRFEINTRSAHRAGLKIDSELLKLATRVYDDEHDTN